MARKRTSQGPRTPSQRQLRVGELVRHALSDILTRDALADPALEARTVTVPEVRMSPDLKIASVYVMPLGGGDEQAVVKALARHARYLRGAMAGRLELKFVPELRFLADPSFAEAERIDTLLRSPQVRRDLDETGPNDNGDDDDEGSARA